MLFKMGDGYTYLF